jgi:hypothetical protein
MKKTSWIASFLILLAGAVGGFAQGAGLYGQQIVVDANSTEAADELADWLGKVTKVSFKVVSATATAPTSGICMLDASSKLAAPSDLARLKDKCKEAFVIRSEGDGLLWITGNSIMALRHGVYSYLDQLGCRWFFPNDHWTIIPSLKSIVVKADRVEAPAFHEREFGGTGGFGGDLVVDPKRSMQGRWAQWSARNRMGGEMPLSGHTGEAFNMAHKKDLLAHPEYLAEIKGKRVPFDEIAKPCVSNPAARKLYIDWTLKRFDPVMEKDPDGPHAWGISVEPADGGGHCECAQCRKIGNGSPTDQVFFLANEVAKAMAADFPGKKVSLLAYNEHAMVPSIPLEPNVVVWVTPYGFNRTGLTGDDLLMAWGKKCKEIAVYDYWLIPDWSNNLPDMDYLDAMPARLRFWNSVSVKAFCGESTYSSGSVGLVWYVASRLMWNPAADVKTLVADFYQKSFGPAAPPMKRMLERWCKGFLPVPNEIGLSFRDLQEARKLATDDATRARINDYVLYVQYLRLWVEYQQAARGQPSTAKDVEQREEDEAQQTKAREQAIEALLTHCWRIYDSTMVHSYRMAMLITHRYEKGDLSKKLIARWPMSNKPEADEKADGWKNFLASVKPPTSADIDQMVADGVQKFKTVEYEARSYSDKVVPLNPPGKPVDEWAESPPMACTQDCLFWAADGVSQVPIMITTGQISASTITVTVKDPSGKVVLTKQYGPKVPWEKLVIPTAAPGLYQMNIFDPKVTYMLKVPKNLPFVLKGGFLSTSQNPKTYFYVPKGLKRIAFYANGAIPFELYDLDGVKSEEKVNGFVVYDIPAGFDDQVWSLAGFKSWEPFRALNFPALFSFSAEGMMVPEEVLAKRPAGK